MNNCCNNIYPSEDMNRWESCPSTMLANADNYYTKNQVDEKLEEIVISGGGITSGEVQSMIDASVEPIEGSVEALSGAVEQLSTDLENKADKSDIPSLENYYNKTEVNTIIEDNEYTISQAINDLNDRKLDASAYTPVDMSGYWTSGETQEAINAATSGTPSSATIERLRTDVNALSGDVTNLYETKLDASAYTPTDLSNYYNKSEVNNLLDDKLDVSAYTPTDLSSYWTSAQTQSAIDNAVSGIQSNILAVDWEGLTSNMNDEKWNELVDAFQNNNPIYAIVDYSGEGFIDIDQKPIDGYVFIDGNTGEQGSRIELKRLTGGGYDWITITKNGSNDYTVTNGNVQYTPTDLSNYWTSAQTKNYVDNAISGITGITIDQNLDSGSTNAVTNSAITNALDAKADASNIYNKTEVNNLISSKANVWCGDEASFNALTNKDANTIYLVY